MENDSESSENDSDAEDQNVNEAKTETESRIYSEEQLRTLDEQLDQANEPIRSRVLKDAFHLMDQINVPCRYGSAKDFSRKLRDALFVADDDDKKLVEAVLLRQGTTWKKKLLAIPAWIFRRVKRKH